ncbi:hypothetical protein GOODEAATRI_028477, partial [Goodea atripinnis]
SVSNYESHRFSPQHPHPPNYAKHLGSIRRHRKPVREPWRSDSKDQPLTFCHMCDSPIYRHFYLYLQVLLDSPASPPLQQEQPHPSHQWVPHPGRSRPPSTQEGGSLTRGPASPPGSPALEVVEDGKPKDRARRPNQRPAPATPLCLTHHLRIDPTTMLASQQWEEALPVRVANHR